MTGFININKAVGVSSAREVAIIKRLTHTPCGHMGTLDPMADGVLPVAVGNASRLFDFFLSKEKTYVATFRFGENFDTLDTTGSVTERGGRIPTESEIEKVIPTLVGEVMQVPPKYSAKNVNGKRGYQLARDGVEFELPPKKVTIYSIKLLRREDENSFTFEITCGGGTYIRSLARDIAATCGTVGYMSGLIRLQSGCFGIENAYTLDEIRERKQACLLDIMYPLADVDECVFPVGQYENIDFGRKVKCPFNGGYRKIYCKNVFFGLGVNEGGYLKIKYYLKNV